MSVTPPRLQQVDSIPLAVIRRQVHQSELSRVVPEGCGAVWTALRAQQIKAGRHVAVYWDNTIRLEVGVEIAVPFAETDELVASATPAGPVATATLFGPYGQLGQAHQTITAWCAGNGHRLAGPSWEIYGHWVDGWNSDPSKIRTDVFYLLTQGG